MSETAARYRSVAAGFTRRVEGVPQTGWSDPAPCEGWVARDVVRHVVDTSGFFLGMAGLDVTGFPSVDTDPVAAWHAARDAVLSALDDPEACARQFDGPMGRTTIEEMVGRFGIADLVVHTWDLARATGQDEELDTDEVRRAFALMEPNDEMMRKGDAFGARVEVPDDADDQTRLIAFTGRRP
jgi:uncharacterized protein (TIGR03086 family)